MKDENNSNADEPANMPEKTPESKRVSSKGASRRKNMRKQGPIWDKGNKRERTRVCVYKIQSGENIKWRVRWYEAGCKKAQTRTHCSSKEAAVADAERIYKLVLENKVDIGRIDESTLFELRETERMLAGTGDSAVSAVRRLLAIEALVPKGKTLNDVLQRGLAALSNAAKHEEPMSVVKPLYLTWAQHQNGLCENTCKYIGTVLNRLGVLLGNRPISEIDEQMIYLLLARYKAGNSQSHAELGRCRKFLRWSRGNGYFPKNVGLPTDCIELPAKRVRTGAPLIYPASDLQRILDLAPESLKPAIILVLGNFFRPEEAYGMTYEQLFRCWDEGWVWIPDCIAKRAKRKCTSRWAFIPPTTKKLFAPYMNCKGLIYPHGETPARGNMDFSHFMNSNQIKVRRDALRKTCISACVAMAIPKALIASWSGNSESVIDGYYNNKECTSYFAFQWLGVLMGIPPEDPAIKQMVNVFKTAPVKPEQAGLGRLDLINRVRK